MLLFHSGIVFLKIPKNTLIWLIISHMAVKFYFFLFIAIKVMEVLESPRYLTNLNYPCDRIFNTVIKRSEKLWLWVSVASCQAPLHTPNFCSHDWGPVTAVPTTEPKQHPKDVTLVKACSGSLSPGSPLHHCWYR